MIIQIPSGKMATYDSLKPPQRHIHLHNVRETSNDKMNAHVHNKISQVKEHFPQEVKQ